MSVAISGFFPRVDDRGLFPSPSRRPRESEGICQLQMLWVLRASPPPLCTSLRLSHGVSVHYLFKIQGFAQSRGSYALEGEHKMGQLLELTKKNAGAKGIGSSCHPWFTQAARERQWPSRPTVPSIWDIFFP